MASSSRSRPKAKEQQSETQVSANPIVEPKADTNLQVETREKQMSDEIRSLIEYNDDLSNAEAPVPLPTGTYVGEVRGAEVKDSSKGSKYVSVTFHINSDDYPPDYTEGDPDGTILTYNRISPENTTRARFAMKRFCEALGAPMGRTIDLNDWLGKSALLEVTHDTYEGITRAQIKSVKPA